jgi:hypothetical protein
MKTLKSWESDGQPIASTEKQHYTVKGVMRRIRKLQARGRYGYGECGDGGYIVAVEQVPNSFSQE